MKDIAFYIGSMQKGGANRVISVLSEYFAELGHNVTLINDILPEDDKPEYEVHRMVRRMFLDDRKGIHSSTFTRMKRLRRFLKDEKPDIIVSFMGPPNIRMLLSSIGIRCRKIVSVRNDPQNEYGDSKVERFIAGVLFRMADGCVFQTSDASEYFPKSVRKKSKIILNPISNEFFEVKRSANPRNVITVGRLESQKNQSLLIRAFARIADRYPEDSLVIFGEGALRYDLEKQANELGIAERVKMLGISPKIAERLAEAKLFVLPSDFEGLPNALMEAMACGVPVISTDCPCGGPRSLIENRHQGVLVECGDVEGLANAISDVLGNRDLQNDLSNGARIRALEFKSSHILQEWKDYIMVD